jgi:4-hydroxybenzoate polyprenyltransferase
MINNLKEMYYLHKRYILFFIAALSLLIAGGISSDYVDVKTLFLLSSFTILGVFWVYKINDIVDHNHTLKYNLKHFFSNKYYIISSLCILFLIIFGAFIVTPFRFKYLAISGLLGALYSFDFTILNFKFKLKKIFLLKNLSIGIGWGLLIPIGSGSFNSELIVILTLLTINQVFIGSMIRDIPDRDKDLSQNVDSFPAKLGFKKTIIFMFILNLTPIFWLFLNSFPLNSSILIISVSAWRTINLIMLIQKPHSKFWLQTFNLMTCVIILLIVLINKLWIN